MSGQENLASLPAAARALMEGLVETAQSRAGVSLGYVLIVVDRENGSTGGFSNLSRQQFARLCQYGAEYAARDGEMEDVPAPGDWSSHLKQGRVNPD